VPGADFDKRRFLSKVRAAQRTFCAPSYGTVGGNPTGKMSKVSIPHPKTCLIVVANAGE